jgi:hypothetical protein
MTVDLQAVPPFGARSWAKGEFIVEQRQRKAQ